GGDKTGARAYWQLVAENFENVTFFLRPAGFLLGRVDEATFKTQIDTSPDLKAFGTYVIGLKHRLSGNNKAARTAYKRCLELSLEKDPLKMRIPFKWAREDLEHLQQQNVN
ncbi:MAG: hypothetical protein PVI06_17860, partial [Desulfobacterales bacterium]